MIADSSTVAMPSITSPSQGTSSPACTSTTSPLRSSPAGCFQVVAPKRGSRRRVAHESFFMPRRLAACALLRPSASASARFANSTVIQSQQAIAPMKLAGASPGPEQRLDPESGREQAAHEHDEHHRIANLLARIELGEGVDEGRTQELRREQGEAGAGHGGFVRVSAGQTSARCSTTGPSASAGR